MFFPRLPSAATVTLAGFFALHPAPVPRASRDPVDPHLYAGLRWRNIGPFRGGRVAAVTGAVGEPGVFYAGFPAAGVWKTTSAGEVWYPVFDSVTGVSSVGAIEAAPSAPNVIYAGTGDIITGGAINEGNGVYKSTDAGATWQHVGLDESKQIPSIIVDPHDPNLVLVAAQGDIHKKGGARGVFRTTDGGRTWTRTLYVDDETGIAKIARAFDVPNVVFATTMRHYDAPGAPPRAFYQPDSSARTGTALYKSTDDGVTWHEVTGGGLPRMTGRTSVAVAMNTSAQRIFLVTNTGLYRSDDGGTTWRQMDAQDERIRNGQGGYNCGVYVDPQNPDVVYVFNTSSYVSRDGGNTFTGFKGAPGGDDPQQLWIDPTNGKRIFMGMDQGATITLDGGHTWSSWYNQSTEQIYHLSVDNSFPYWVYATQQDAGAIRTRARGNFGEITPLDWNPVSGWEWGSIVADPLDPNRVYASGNGIVKISYPSEQWINVSPAADPAAQLRVSQSQPIVFAPWNRHELLAGFQYVMSTTDAGAHWIKLSPDLGRRKDGPPPSGMPSGAPPTGGTIESISASTVAPGTIWVGTTNGLVHVTRDRGKTWQNVSISDVPEGNTADVLSVDASHTDAAGAYVAIDHHRTGDYRTYLYRTHDYGKTWTKIVNGLPTDQPNGSFARVVRADPVKAGLLFAGTESGMYVSFDDGDHWQPLELNLPTTSYRDIAFKGNDLIVGTYGRGIWVLDGYTVLRQLSPNGVVQASSEPAHLFRPDTAIRVRRNVNADTPFPPEIPHALNPPDGAIIYYSLSQKPSTDIALDVLDASGDVVRHMSSAPIAPVAEAEHPPEPNFWIATPAPMPTEVGTNRVNWDLRYDAPPAFSHSFEINANPGLTPPSPEGLLAPPGTYTLRLTVDGHAYTQPLVVRNDPRSPASTAAVLAQHALLSSIYDAIRVAWNDYRAADSLRASAHALLTANPPADVTAALSAFESKLDSIAGGARGSRIVRGRFGPALPPTFMATNGALVGQLEAQDNGDMPPTAAGRAAFATSCRQLGDAASRFQQLLDQDLPALNVALAKAGLRTLSARSRSTHPRC